MENCFNHHKSNLPGYFATLPKEDVDNENLKYDFLYDYIGNKCYVINLDKCRNHFESGDLTCYKGNNYSIQKQYERWFSKNMIVSKERAEELKSLLIAGKPIPY